jgi:hypothetical protein
MSAGARIVGPSMMDTPRCRETGRPPTAQFAVRAVYIHGEAKGARKKVT